MSRSFIECEFFIPRRRDKDHSDGAVHSLQAWDWLDDRLYEAFGGLSIAPGWYEGFWLDPDTGKRVRDVSAKYIVAVSERKLRILREILTQACDRFHQKAIYLSVGGRVEFLQAEKS